MIGGRYSREREIGRGGMGSVWLGRDEVLGRPVAIKRVGVMPGGSSPDLLRAEREARIAASLNHPHVVGVFDLVHEDDQQWLVMEYVPGTTLGDLIRSRGALPADLVRDIAGQAAQALSAAHEAGIVHRDVKPSNILVRDDGQVKISDFGIARAEADASLTQTGLVTGSPAYLAPEVASGRLASTASDVWSLGATVHHALSGRPPYDVGDNVLGAMYRIVNDPPPRLDDPGPLGPLLDATLVHEPGDRWTMAQVVDFLQTGAPSAPRRVPNAPVAPDPVAPAPVAPAPVGSADPPATSVLPTPDAAPTPAPAPPAAQPAADPRRRRPVLPVLIGVLVIALLGVIAALALSDDPQPNLGADPGQTSSSEATSGSGEPSSSPPTSSAPTAQELEDFARSYVATASSDPAAGFQELTPAYQRRSTGYEGFWGAISNPRIQSISADPDALTVTYTYRYRHVDRGEVTETVTLQLVRDGDGFLIDGDT